MRQAKTAHVDTSGLTGSASRNVVDRNVEQMFENGHIRALNATQGLAKVAQDNWTEELDERLGSVEQVEITKGLRESLTR